MILPDWGTRVGGLGDLRDHSVRLKAGAGDMASADVATVKANITASNLIMFFYRPMRRPKPPGTIPSKSFLAASDLLSQRFQVAFHKLHDEFVVAGVTPAIAVNAADQHLTIYASSTIRERGCAGERCTIGASLNSKGTPDPLVRSPTNGGLPSLRGPNDHRNLPISRVRHRAHVAVVELVHGHICETCRFAHHVTVYSLNHGA